MTTTLLSESVCNDDSTTKSVIDFIFNSMKEGNIMVLFKRKGEYKVVLMGEKE